MGYYDPRKMWFGTQPVSRRSIVAPGDPGRMQWVDAPVQGADLSVGSWGTSSQLLSGGAYAAQSAGSHKTYSFEWRQSTSPEMVSLLQGYRDGVYGNGLLHFVTPDAYETNVLPARWAAPGSIAGVSGMGLPFVVYNSSISNEAKILNPRFSRVLTPENDWGLPTSSLVAEGDFVSGVPYDPVTSGLFVPIPSGFSLTLRWWGNSGILQVNRASGGFPAYLPSASFTGSGDNTYTFSSSNTGGGLYLSLGGSFGGGGFGGEFSGIQAFLVSNSAPPSYRTQVVSKPWMGGMGHSGCRFAQAPTVTYNSPNGGGRMSIAATFTEVGDTLRGW